MRDHQKLHQNDEAFYGTQCGAQYMEGRIL